MRYFKKSVPRTPIWLSNGDALRFPTLDNITGYYATENPAEIQALELCQQQGKGGVAEIDVGEYEADYAKKKPSPPPPLEREVISPGAPPDTTGVRSAPSIAPPAATDPQPGGNVASPSAPLPPPSKPRVGKRPGTQE